MPYRPGIPVSAQAVALSVGGWNRSVSTPWPMTAATRGTNVAAACVVAMIASIRAISSRGSSECRRCAAEVNTIRIGRRRMSRTAKAIAISRLRRTCQIA